MTIHTATSPPMPDELEDDYDYEAMLHSPMADPSDWERLLVAFVIGDDGLIAETQPYFEDGRLFLQLVRQAA